MVDGSSTASRSPDAHASPRSRDPQERCPRSAGQGHRARFGFNGVGDVRQGKLIAFDLAEQDRATAAAKVVEMCEKLLANTVIENYSIELDGEAVDLPRGGAAADAGAGAGAGKAIA